jgi:hypothetical protein
MLQKNRNASRDERVRGLARGMVIQEHTIAWFREHWPEFYRDADNTGQWTRPCRHDFKLQVPGHGVLEIDIAGPRRDGTYGNPVGGKPKTDLHLLCRLDVVGQNIVWEGVVSGKRYAQLQTVVPELTTSPESLTVWLNCVQAGLDYGGLKHAFAQRLHQGRKNCA